MTEKKYREAMQVCCATVVSGILQGLRATRQYQITDSLHSPAKGWDSAASSRVREAVRAIEGVKYGTNGLMVNGSINLIESNGSLESNGGRSANSKALTNGSSNGGTSNGLIVSSDYVSNDQQVELITNLAGREEIRLLLREVLSSVASATVETAFYCFGDLLSFRSLSPGQITGPVIRKLIICW